MELVVVAPILNQIEAEILKGRLDSEGIEAFVDSSNLLAARSSYSNRVEGLRVSVWEKDYEAAMAIVAETLPGQTPVSGENEPDIIAITDRVNSELGYFLESKSNLVRVALIVLGIAVTAYFILYLAGAI